MSRHRNVRSMNYSDEYDGYDDVYGHSVEDEYCISPSDEAQFMYDRTRQPQISAFFSEQDNITEEDENADQSNDRKNSNSYLRPTLSDLDEAKLQSCLDEIRNVIGDSVSEAVLVETILKCNFNVNKSLDTVLSNAPSSIEPIGDAPKPQRIRRDRDRDFINFQSNILCLVSHNDVNLLTENISGIELQDCEENLFCNENAQNSERDVSNKLNIKHCNAASCKFVLEQYKRNQQSRIKGEKLNTDCCSLLTSQNIPNSFPQCEVNTSQTGRKNSKAEVENSVQTDDTNKFLRKSDNFSGICILKHEGTSIKKMTEKKNLLMNINLKSRDKPHVSMHESKADMLLDNYSSDEDCNSSPLTTPAKQLSNVACGDRRQHENEKLVGSLTEEGGKMDTDGRVSQNEAHDQCHQAFRNLTIQESDVLLSDMGEKNKVMLNVPTTSKQSSVRTESSQDTDNSDEEKNTCSPLAALANRHRKFKGTEYSFSDKSEHQPINLFFTKEQNSDTTSGKSISRAAESCESNVESFCGDKDEMFFTDRRELDSTLLNRSSDDEENVFSPLAALADRYNRGKGTSSSVSIGLESRLEQRCDHLQEPSSSTSISLVGSGDRVRERTAKALCKCSSSPSSCGLSCTHEFATKQIPQEEVEHDLHASLLTQAACTEQEAFLTHNKSASSLSDLAFFHLTRSASCSMKSDSDLTNKRFHSDSGISKSVPGGFVIPFLKQEEGFLKAVQRNEKAIGQVDAQGDMESDASMDSADGEWVIDLSSAIRDPGLRLPCASPEDKLPAKIIDVLSTEEVLENTTKIPVKPCELDTRGMLKMKFSYTKRKCSPFGNILCHQWRELTKPYIPPTKKYTGTVVCFTFDTKSPDDQILFHLNRKK